MNDHHNLKMWALIQVQLAQLEAMKAANIIRQMQGYAIAYDEVAFNQVAIAIEALAERIVVE